MTVCSSLAMCLFHSSSVDLAVPTTAVKTITSKTVVVTTGRQQKYFCLAYVVCLYNVCFKFNASFYMLQRINLFNQSMTCFHLLIGILGWMHLSIL